jgi:bis(5'-nucleosyl)-tetraphosphatase (symmetrical)
VADVYFQKHGRLPPPAVTHAVLALESSKISSDNGTSLSRKGILVIGDVHGCLDELKELYEKAVEQNEGIPFRYVILVGDLGNKGPQSAEVIRYVRTRENWLSVRGNHDDGALMAALGDESRRRTKKYQWVMDGEEKENDASTIVLSDDDVLWMAELPYTIRIPGPLLKEDRDTLIVHAGLVPGIDLEEQSIETMITVREVERIGGIDANNDSDDSFRLKYSSRSNSDPAADERFPWASLWKGPYRVIFGHDARRGLQRYDDDWAIGLDTGVVYGKKLTGLILPERTLVQVDAKEIHSPPGGRND